ncbi:MULTISPECIES: ECF transporter S component [Furfurilactobacillus]|uniref:ECF transporter S component n=1 Tax=Furfurilactobacillus rossiae TaxID=231049 RepID=A0A7C9J1N6_9LACO|nr:ECF transporter S component [Furfurilactobacillus milii]MYV05638.1 ECF transporter S component [Furfurilactobacillus milii]
MKSSSSTNTRNLVLAALFIAIIIVQVLVPFLGYIPLGLTALGIQISIIQFTVAIAAIVMGPWWGGLIGGVWGLASLIQAWTTVYNLGAFLFRNPVTAILPRVMIGIVVGYIFQELAVKRQHRGWALTLSGFMASFTNTALVVVFSWITIVMFHIYFPGIPHSGTFTWILLSLVGVNGIAEMIAGVIIVPIIGGAILAVRRSR